MINFKIFTAKDAPAKAQTTLKSIEKTMGFIPNALGLLANSPAALDGYEALAQQFAKTSLTPLEQQIVLLATSVENQCAFCVAAHSTVAKKNINANPAIIDAVRDGRNGPDKRINALVSFTQAVTSKRGAVHDADIQAFMNAGFTQENVLEVILGVTVKTLSNYANHLIDTPPNAELAAESWMPHGKQQQQKAA